MRKVLVTGATGMIGGELALRLARTDDVYCLVRGTEQEALAKLKARGLDGVKLILGDLTGPYQLPDLDLVVHAAAETSFVQDERCQLTNVRGTELLLERLAAQKFSGLFCYISTACNVGAVLGACLREEEGCLVDNRHHNSYTLSKAHAETLVQRSGLDVLTIRPSVVVSAGIDNPVFARQILWFAPLIRKFSSLPLVRSSRLDVIPVAFLADATIGLIDRPVRRHDCYNVSAGRQAATLGDWLVEIEAHYPPAAPLQIVESLDEAVAWRLGPKPQPKSASTDGKKSSSAGMSASGR